MTAHNGDNILCERCEKRIALRDWQEKGRMDKPVCDVCWHILRAKQIARECGNSSEDGE
jgi:hypothetical protein